MKVSLRLSELLGQYHDRDRGCIKRICEETNLERHQVAAVLNNATKYISPELLAGIASYMWKVHRVEPERLLGSLFRVESEEFATWVAGCPYLEICLGMRMERVRRTETRETMPTGGDPERQDQPRTGPRWRWVMAADSYLHAALLHEIFGLQGLNHTADTSRLPHAQPRRMEQRLVREYDVQRGADQMRVEAESAYQEFERIEGGKGLICLGSIKSNVLVESVIARWYASEPFRSQDDVARPGDRDCPFFLRLREEDPPLRSSHAGMRLSASKGNYQPGIYYEKTPNDWGFCPCDETNDVAVVFYRYDVPRGRLEAVIGGYSGRATFALASKLSKLIGAFSKPVYEVDDLRIGAFIIPLEFRRFGREAESEEGDYELVEPNPRDIIRMSEKSIARRLPHKP